jgi:hypothetical protein
MKTKARISQKQIQQIEQDIGERDRNILKSLQKCRYLTSNQINRLHFTNSPTPNAAIRAANRNLRKLTDYGVIEALRRRIGGARAGSGSFVYALTDAGYKVLHLHKADYLPRKRFTEPSPLFLEHTLLSSEAYIQLKTICERDGMNLADLQFEPTCWRWDSGKKKKSVPLKPDLFATTHSGEYEDCWFIEIDRDTEPFSAVLNKCDRYIEYRKTGAEQEKRGIFPYVLWIVPSVKRKDGIIRNISERFPRDTNLFIVITPDELEPLIVGGVEAFKKRIINQAKGESI